MKAVGRKRSSMSSRRCAHLQYWSSLANTFGIQMEWAIEFRFPITDAAWPLVGHKDLCYHWTHKRSLDVLLQQIAVVCITQAIKAERFKRRAKFFIPWYVLIARRCIPCHRRWGKRQRCRGEIEEMSRRCFWDEPDKCQRKRVSHFSACLIAVSLRRWSPTHYPWI